MISVFRKEIIDGVTSIENITVSYPNRLKNLSHGKHAAISNCQNRKYQGI